MNEKFMWRNKLWSMNVAPKVIYYTITCYDSIFKPFQWNEKRVCLVTLIQNKWKEFGQLYLEWYVLFAIPNGGIPNWTSIIVEERFFTYSTNWIVVYNHVFCHDVMFYWTPQINQLQELNIIWIRYMEGKLQLIPL